MNKEHEELEQNFNTITTDKQKELFHKREIELMMMGCEIKSLNISDEWIDTFTHMAYYRGWVDLNTFQKEDMESIGSIDSESIFMLANWGKKVGLRMLYRLSVEIEDEPTRQRAVSLIIDKGVTESKKELQSIITMAKSGISPSLFD